MILQTALPLSKDYEAFSSVFAQKPVFDVPTLNYSPMDINNQQNNSVAISDPTFRLKIHNKNRSTDCQQQQQESIILLSQNHSKSGKSIDNRSNELWGVLSKDILHNHYQEMKLKKVLKVREEFMQKHQELEKGFTMGKQFYQDGVSFFNDEISSKVSNSSSTNCLIDPVKKDSSIKSCKRNLNSKYSSKKKTQTVFFNPDDPYKNSFSEAILPKQQNLQNRQSSSNTQEDQTAISRISVKSNSHDLLKNQDINQYSLSNKKNRKLTSRQMQTQDKTYNQFEKIKEFIDLTGVVQQSAQQQSMK
eukprot:403370316